MKKKARQRSRCSRKIQLATIAALAHEPYRCRSLADAKTLMAALNARQSQDSLLHLIVKAGQPGYEAAPYELRIVETEL